MNIERALVVPTLTGVGSIAVGYAGIPTFSFQDNGVKLFGLGFGSEVVGQYSENAVKPLLV